MITLFCSKFFDSKQAIMSLISSSVFEASKDNLISLLEDDESVLLALLFGSVAKGQATQMSDIDIAIYWDPKQIGVSPNLFQLTLELEGKLQSEIDYERIQVTPLNIASPALRFHAFKDGIILKSVSDLLVTQLRYETIRDFIDSQYVRNSVVYSIRRALNG